MVICPKEDQVFDRKIRVFPLQVGLPEGRLSPGSRPDEIAGLLAFLQDDLHLATDHLYETVHRRGFHHPGEVEVGGGPPEQANPNVASSIGTPVRIVISNLDSPGATESGGLIYSFALG